MTPVSRFNMHEKWLKDALAASVQSANAFLVCMQSLANLVAQALYLVSTRLGVVHWQVLLRLLLWRSPTIQ